jgi:serine phosphatase RsbU (regulator of sigma subunit)
VCAKLNVALCDSIPSAAFVSLFYAVIAPDRKQLTYCNAGHNPPILMSDGPTRRLHHGGGILGVFPEWKYEDQQIDLRPRDRILLYTDGVTECRNVADEFFGEEQLLDFVDRFEDDDSIGLLPGVIDMVTRFSNGNFDDDLTLVTVSIE